MPPTHRPVARQAQQHDTVAYQAFLAGHVTDEALLADALTVYQATIADALAVSHQRNPLALVNIRLRWTLAQVSRLIAVFKP